MRRDVLSQVKRAEQSDQVSGAARFNVFAYIATHQSYKLSSSMLTSGARLMTEEVCVSRGLFA